VKEERRKRRLQRMKGAQTPPPRSSRLTEQFRKQDAII